MDANGNLTSTGTIYLNQISTPSIPESLVNTYNNNLQSRMNEITTINNVVSKKAQLDYQFNAAGKNLVINSVSLDSVNLLNMQGMHLKQITSNTKTNLSDLPSGVYILAVNGFKPEKLFIY